MSINFNEYKKKSFKSTLREFYDSLESKNIHLEKSDEKKRDFFNRSRGLFLDILKMKNRVSVESIAQKMRFTVEEYLKIESGSDELTDAQFFEICNFLGGNSESSVFLEKIEEAFKPEVKKARFEMAKSLKDQFGIHFSDSDKYDKSKKGQILNIDFRKKVNK